MQRHLGVLVAACVAWPALAQDRVDGPYYKFSTEIPGSELGLDTADEVLTMEYFAIPEGRISGLSLVPQEADGGTGQATSPRLAGCQPICVPDPSSPTGVRCIGCWGPNSIFVSIDPVSTEDSLDFRIGVQGAFGEGRVDKMVEGLRALEGDGWVPAEATE